MRWRAIARSARACALRAAQLPVEDLAGFDFSRADIGLFSAGSEISAEYAPKAAAAAGCIVIDNTSQFRYQDDIPLVVPEVNAHAIAQLSHARHHRQSELLNHPDAGRAEADLRCGRDRAHQRRDLSVGIGRRPGGGRGTGNADRGAAQRPPDRCAAADCRSRSPSIACRRSIASRTTATPRKR